MMNEMKNRLTDWKTEVVILGYFLETLIWSRKIVRRARPTSYFVDCLFLSCTLLTILIVL